MRAMWDTRYRPHFVSSATYTDLKAENYGWREMWIMRREELSTATKLRWRLWFERPMPVPKHPPIIWETNFLTHTKDHVELYFSLLDFQEVDDKVLKMVGSISWILSSGNFFLNIFFDLSGVYCFSRAFKFCYVFKGFVKHCYVLLVKALY
jgi:hypothetical protein